MFERFLAAFPASGGDVRASAGATAGAWLAAAGGTQFAGGLSSIAGVVNHHRR